MKSHLKEIFDDLFRPNPERVNLLSCVEFVLCHNIKFDRQWRLRFYAIFHYLYCNCINYCIQRSFGKRAKYNCRFTTQVYDVRQKLINLLVFTRRECKGIIINLLQIKLLSKSDWLIFNTLLY